MNLLNIICLTLYIIANVFIVELIASNELILQLE